MSAGRRISLFQQRTCHTVHTLARLPDLNTVLVFWQAQQFCVVEGSRELHVGRRMQGVDIPFETEFAVISPGRAWCLGMSQLIREFNDHSSVSMPSNCAGCTSARNRCCFDKSLSRGENREEFKIRTLSRSSHVLEVHSRSRQNVSTEALSRSSCSSLSSAKPWKISSRVGTSGPSCTFKQ